MQVGEINVRIDADTSGLDKGVKKTKDGLQEIEQQSEKSSKAVTAFSKANVLAIGALTAAIGGGIAMMAKQADSIRILEQRIKTATRATGDYAQVSKELYSISQATGSTLESNVVLFQQLARAATEVGATNTEVLTLTKSLQQLGTIGGSSAEQMSNAMLQFGQAMAGGVMRAEEFNSIVENTPEIAVRIADGMGMTVGELRNAVLEGKVLSEEVFSSLLSQTQDINKQFNEMNISLDRASTMFSNSLNNFLADADTGLSFTEQIAKGLQGWSMWMDSVNPKMTEHEKINLRIYELRKKINEGASLFGNSTSQILNWQKELKKLEEDRAKLWASQDAKKAKEAELAATEKAIKAEKEWFDQQFKQAEQQQQWMEYRSDKTESYNRRQLKALEEQIRKAEELRKATGDWITMLNEQTGVFDKEDEQKALDEEKYQENSQKSLDKLLEKYKTEEELLREKFENQQLIIDEAYLNEQMTEEEHQQTMLEIQERYAEARAKIADAERKDRVNAYSKMFGDLSSLMNTKSKEMFAIGKAAAIANTVISGIEAAEEAFKWGNKIGGLPLGSAMAAASALASAARVQQISSTQIGTSGGTTSVSGGVAAVNTTPAQQSAPVGGTLTVEGLSTSSLFTGDTVSALAEELLEYQRNGGNVVLQG